VPELLNVAVKLTTKILKSKISKRLVIMPGRNPMPEK
jgi:hypothetical protein